MVDTISIEIVISVFGEVVQSKYEDEAVGSVEANFVVPSVLSSYDNEWVDENRSCDEEVSKLFDVVVLGTVVSAKSLIVDDNDDDDTVECECELVVCSEFQWVLSCSLIVPQLDDVDEIGVVVVVVVVVVAKISKI